MDLDLCAMLNAAAIPVVIAMWRVIVKVSARLDESQTQHQADLMSLLTAKKEALHLKSKAVAAEC